MWDRSSLGMTGSELELLEALRALERVLCGPSIGERARGVYDMVINCVEKPLLESVLHRVQGNQTHAAEMLGINRNTLRKKMKAHGIK